MVGEPVAGATKKLFNEFHIRGMFFFSGLCLLCIRLFMPVGMLFGRGRRIRIRKRPMPIWRQVINAG